MKAVQDNRSKAPYVIVGHMDKDQQVCFVTLVHLCFPQGLLQCFVHSRCSIHVSWLELNKSWGCTPRGCDHPSGLLSGPTLSGWPYETSCHLGILEEKAGCPAQRGTSELAMDQGLRSGWKSGKGTESSPRSLLTWKVSQGLSACWGPGHQLGRG